MLYIDSSALVKRYVQEHGSIAVASRFDSREEIYTSILSFAEVHAAIGRKYRERELSAKEKEKLIEEFSNDWLFSLNILELTTQTMSALPDLCEQYFLKASDAIHLSSALWLKDTVLARTKSRDTGNIVEFGVCDLRLAGAARKRGFQIFDPSKSNA